jgi:hypothetical protein
MRVISIAAGLLVATITAFLCIVVPANRTISVGDDGSVLNAFEFYGYPTTKFSLNCATEKYFGQPTSVFFRLDNQWHLRVRLRNNRVIDMTHFQSVPQEHDYCDFIHESDVDAFTIPHTSLMPYFIGLVVLFGIGSVATRYVWVYPAVSATLLFVMLLGNIALARFSETVALFPLLVSIGWVAAYLLGATIFQSTSGDISSP